jgi:hypothetical protein
MAQMKRSERRMANRIKFTDRAREKFLEVLRATCNVSEAARACGISRRTAYDHRDADPDFASAWDDAEQEAADALEREAWRRGVEGVDRPIMYQGQVVARSREYSDRLLELLLKAHRPAKYKERVPSDYRLASGPVELLHEMTDDELIARLKAKRSNAA